MFDVDFCKSEESLKDKVMENTSPYLNRCRNSIGESYLSFNGCADSLGHNIVPLMGETFLPLNEFICSMGETSIPFNGCIDSMGQNSLSPNGYIDSMWDTNLSFSGCTDSIVVKVRMSFDLILFFIYLLIHLAFYTIYTTMFSKFDVLNGCLV